MEVGHPEGGVRGGRPLERGFFWGAVVDVGWPQAYMCVAGCRLVCHVREGRAQLRWMMLVKGCRHRRGCNGTGKYCEIVLAFGVPRGPPGV